MTPKQDPKTEADKLVRDIKRATSAEIESSRTKKKPHRRNDEACCLCDAVMDGSFRLVLLIYRGLRCALHMSNQSHLAYVDNTCLNHRRLLFRVYLFYVLFHACPDIPPSFCGAPRGVSERSPLAPV